MTNYTFTPVYILFCCGSLTVMVSHRDFVDSLLSIELVSYPGFSLLADLTITPSMSSCTS